MFKDVDDVAAAEPHEQKITFVLLPLAAQYHLLICK